MMAAPVAFVFFAAACSVAGAVSRAGTAAVVEITHDVDVRIHQKVADDSHESTETRQMRREPRQEGTVALVSEPSCKWTPWSQVCGSVCLRIRKRVGAAEPGCPAVSHRLCKLGSHDCLDKEALAIAQRLVTLESDKYGFPVLEPEDLPPVVANGDVSGDCELSEWAEWSACAVTCGPGTRTRNRTITRQAGPGGAACGGITNMTEQCYDSGCPERPGLASKSDVLPESDGTLEDMAGSTKSVTVTKEGDLEEEHPAGWHRRKTLTIVAVVVTIGVLLVLGVCGVLAFLCCGRRNADKSGSEKLLDETEPVAEEEEPQYEEDPQYEEEAEVNAEEAAS